MKKTTLLSLAAVALACAASGAQAQSAGTFIARLGATQISPKVDSGDLSAPSLAGTKIDVHKDTQFTGGITYMWTDNIAIDLPIGLAFKHDVVGAGAIDGVGKLGTVKSLPITLLAQYRFFDAKSTFRPYVGAGATYARFYDTHATAALSGLTGGTPSNPTTLSMKNAGGASIQLGAAMNLGGHWTADVSVMKVFIKTTGKLSTGQTIPATLNPTAVQVGIGYAF
ncbi:OmpW family outer membrane protein [Paucibacter sp. R3-3]|uniref:OmpW family outer membrane protein n=1 Tax=Roseateles agri TaxID=3098619 RepID=A0ABU5DEM7_9BURK|nr:OmpW family outer membrane protein [Paucibacter sp. R3-3]MDY0744730.1 OmpW family outer membrane protein [Paucibacter sp. R3-3]